MNKNCPHRGKRMRIVHNNQEANTVENRGRSMTKIYAVLDNMQTDYQFHKIGVEVKINNQLIAILINYGTSHSNIDLNLVERFHLKQSKHGKY